jgi:hypothetical protein
MSVYTVEIAEGYSRGLPGVRANLLDKKNGRRIAGR